MNYAKCLSLLALFSLFSLQGMQCPEASFLEETNDSPRKIASYSPTAQRYALKNLSNNLEESAITSAPVISEDFNTPIDELPIMENIQPCSTHNSPATTPMKAFYSHAAHNFKTTVQKRLFQEATIEQDAPLSIPVAFSPAAPSAAVSSSDTLIAQTFVVPWTQSKRAKKSKPFDGSLMIITATPSLFTGVQSGTRIRKKANKVLTQPAGIQENVNLDHAQPSVLELPTKQLVQVKGQLRTTRPEHASMSQFSLLGPKKRKSRLSLKNCESLKKIDTQNK